MVGWELGRAAEAAALLPSLLAEIRDEKTERARERLRQHFISNIPNCLRATALARLTVSVAAFEVPLSQLYLAGQIPLNVYLVGSAPRVCACVSFRDKRMKEGESGGPKRSKKKQKKEDAWRSEGPRDPVAMVCVFVCCLFYIFLILNNNNNDIN